METENKKLVVVLGMHRSGTSAITRGLQVMGVGLGERMMPPVEGNNTKGFWEDIDLNSLNIEILNTIESDWHHLAPIEISHIEKLRNEGYLLRAVELLRQKISSAPIFGFKDPRVAKLLPFWKEAFSHCQFNVNYVLAMRHPLSVVKSLAKRDGLAAEQSYLLWLGHVIESLTGSAGSKRVLVDYDRLMQSPDDELMRIAKSVDLKIDPAELQSYKTEFLDPELRHTVYDLNDLLLDNACPPIVREVYAALLDVASDKARFEDVELQSKIVGWSNEFERLKSPLLLADRLFTQKLIATQAVTERDSQIANLNQALAARERRSTDQLASMVSKLAQETSERAEEIANLNQAVSERDSQIANLNQALAARERRSTDQLASMVSKLAQETSERAEEITNLNQAVTERDGQIANLNDAVAERDAQVGNLKQTVAEREGQIGQILLSISWRLTRPLRVVRSIFVEKDAPLNVQTSTPDGFNNAWYLKRNPDVALNGMDPYEHYVTFGKAEWRQPEPDNFVRRNIRRAQLVSRALTVAIRRAGGVISATRKALTVLNRNGWSGVRHRLILLGTQIDPTEQPTQFERNDYTEWVSRYDTLTERDREEIKSRINQLHKTPLISVVMPVYNPPLNMLEDAIRSVQDQLYPNWELCIADDASTDMGVHKLLQRCSDSDSRIKVVFREKNGHISAASNSALELVKGEYIALLDNDDLLPEHALFWVADAIVNNPDAGLIYSDEDKIDQAGRRYDPYFKPDWNPDLFLSHNMICHMGVYRTDLVRQLGGFREGYEGAQDYDLALRCTEQLAHQKIVHIPRVLYHWRSHPGSTAQAGSEKNYALLAGERALNDHFVRAQIAAKAVLLDFGMYRARYAIPTPAPLVSLIIPTRNGLKLIRQCIESIFAKTTYKNYEILIVDNNSDDPDTLAYFTSLAKDNRIRILRDERPFNYSALNNAAVKQARGEYIGLVNNDIEILSPEWLEEMIGLAIQPGVGAVGARLWYPNNTLQHGGVITGIGGVAGHSHKHLNKGSPGYFSRAQLIQTLSVVTAACMIVKRGIFEEVNGLDETNLKVAFNDVDFCLRVREAGYRNVWTPYAELYHHESATRGYEDTAEKQLRFRDEVLFMQKRWGDLLMNDPAYNLNLTLDHEDFSLAWPPRVGLP